MTHMHRTQGIGAKEQNTKKFEFPVLYYVPLYMNNQVHRALFRKKGEEKERERTTTSTGLEKYIMYTASTA